MTERDWLLHENKPYFNLFSGQNKKQCECYSLMHTLEGYFSNFIERKNIIENCASGCMVNYTQCTCKKCGHEWDEQ